MTRPRRIILKAIHEELVGKSTKKMRDGQVKYFKEQVNFLGCSVPQCGKVAKEWDRKLKVDGWSYDDILRLSEDLLKQRTFEEGMVGIDLTSFHKKDFRKIDISIFENWLEKYVNNWAYTDAIAPHIVGELLAVYPELTGRIFGWTTSKNRWVRRAAAVTYVIHGRRGEFKDEIFRTADALISDDDEMVQKGVGWMLKEASKAEEEDVVEYLIRNRKRTSRLVLRYATEKVSLENRIKVLGAR